MQTMVLFRLLVLFPVCLWLASCQENVDDAFLQDISTTVESSSSISTIHPKSLVVTRAPKRTLFAKSSNVNASSAAVRNIITIGTIRNTSRPPTTLSIRSSKAHAATSTTMKESERTTSISESEDIIETSTLAFSTLPSTAESSTTSAADETVIHTSTLSLDVSTEATFNFYVKPYSKFPSTMLEVNFTKLHKYRQYRINFSDVSFNEKVSLTHNTTLVNDNPFVIQNLSPGHKYTLEFLAELVSSGQTVGLGYTMEMTDPVLPIIRPNATIIDTNSIRIHGEKEPEAIQDYYLINFMQLDPPLPPNNVRDMLNVTDIHEQKFVDILINNLNPGRNYNLSITPFRANRPGPVYRQIVATTPLPPSNVQLSYDAKENLVHVSWSGPTNSGVDRFFVLLQNYGSLNVSEFVPLEENHVSMSAHLKPGEHFIVMVYSVKGSRFSLPFNATSVVKPLPPLDILVTPDFEQGSFVVQATTSNESSQDSCYLQYISEEPSSGRLDAHNESAPAVASSICRWTDVALKPGQSYYLQVWAVSNSTASDVLSNSSVTIEPAFDVQRFGVTVLPQETGFEVQWDRLRIANLWRGLVGENGNISVSLFGDSQVTKMASPVADAKSPPKIVFDSLVSGRCYAVQVYSTVAGIVSRNRTRLTVRTDPTSISISLLNITSTSVVIGLKPASFVRMDENCRVSLSVKDRGETHHIFNRTFVFGAQGLTVDVGDLKPFTKYDVNGFHTCGVIHDECVPNRRNLKDLDFETLQGVPGRVETLTVAALTPSIASLHWQRPSQENGIITNYLIMVRPERNSEPESSWNITLPANVEKIDIQNLTGGFSYTFDVRAQSEAGIGQSYTTAFNGRSDTVVQMLVWAPPKPFGKPEILSNTVRETDFSIRFNLTMFSTRNGLLTQYAVIIAEGEDTKTYNASLTWHDIKSLPTWPSYLAIVKPLPQLKSFDPTPVVHILGVDAECSKEADDKEYHMTTTIGVGGAYCNGPLRPGRQYRVKLRAYTQPDLFADSDFSDVVTTHAESNSSAGTAVAVILALLILLAFVLGLLLFLRGRGVDPVHNCLTKSSSFLSPDSVVNGCLSVGGNGNRRQRSLRERTGVDARLGKLHNHHSHHLPLPPTVVGGGNPEVSRSVRKKDFAEHVRFMSADSDFRFSEEYEDLKQVGRQQSCNAADMPCNRNKNRFTNILPFDHSRIKLIPVDDEEGSDFINASYIPAFNSPREFIATQGPLPSTRDDFWRMVWEQNSPGIVNLTKCVEKGREKCDQYWPCDNEPVCYGDIEVVVMNETRFPDWTIREFKVTKGDQSRTVRHYHFTAWPDFGVPENPQVLIKFVRAFRQRTPPDTRPIVVHCSAGVGRSGTFIALDRLLQHILHNDCVDIFGIVYEMRKERVSMVQTEQQYICIHQCLLCVFEERENENSPYLFPRPPPPGAEVHQNPAFEDDEGIAESGV